MVKLSHRTLRKRMVEHQLKQEPFAESIGISVRHLRNLCYKDTDVSVSLCYRISKQLDTSMEELLEISEE